MLSVEVLRSKDDVGRQKASPDLLFHPKGWNLLTTGKIIVQKVYCSISTQTRGELAAALLGFRLRFYLMNLLALVYLSLEATFGRKI